MTARLPDAHFFQQAEDNGIATLVQIQYSGRGGSKSYHLVTTAAELAELVLKSPKKSCVSIMLVGNHLTWDDAVYTADQNGDLSSGSY